MWDSSEIGAAWGLVSLQRHRKAPSCNGESISPAIARLEGSNFQYMMFKNRIRIGRRHGDVDIKMNYSSLISRVHLEISHLESRFFLSCKGRNGVIVDGIYIKEGMPPIELPKHATLRFPWTNRKFYFHSLVDIDNNLPQNLA